jgi:membrane protein DedA with SNARE-associated domain
MASGTKQDGRAGRKVTGLAVPTAAGRTRALSLISHHSAATLLLAKFIAGSNFASLLAGRAGVSAARFLIYDSIGSLTWSGAYIALGYLLRAQLHWTVPQTLRPLLVVRAAIALWFLVSCGTEDLAVFALGHANAGDRPLQRDTTCESVQRCFWSL